MVLTDIIFIYSYLVILVLVFALLRAAGISLSRPSIPMLFVISYLVFSFLGAPMLFFGLNRKVASLGITDRDLCAATCFYSGVALIMVCLGFNYARWVFGLRPRRYDLPEARTIVNVYLPRIFFALIVCLAALLIYIQRVPDLALLNLLKGGFGRVLLEARSDATNALEHAWRFQFFGDNAAPFLSYVLFAAYLHTRRKEYLMGFLFAGAISVFSAIMNLTRGNLVYYIGSLVFLYYLTLRKKIPVRTVVMYTIFAFVFVVGLILAISRTHPLSAALGFVERTFSGYLLAAYFYMQIFPEVHDYLWGLSFPNPGGVFPFEHFPITVYVSEVIFGERIGLVGSAPAPFWAEMYANFGSFGALVVSFLVGIILWIVHVWTTTWHQTMVNDALITFLAFYLQFLAVGSLSKYLFPLEAALVVLLGILISCRVQAPREVISNSQSLSDLPGAK